MSKQNKTAFALCQGSPIRSPRATSGPRSCFVWPASSFCEVDFLVKRLTILLQIKAERSELKPFSVRISRNQFGFVAKTFFFGLLLYFWGQIPETLAEAAPILHNKLAINWSLILVKCMWPAITFLP